MVWLCSNIIKMSILQYFLIMCYKYTLCIVLIYDGGSVKYTNFKWTMHLKSIIFVDHILVFGYLLNSLIFIW